MDYQHLISDDVPGPRIEWTRDGQIIACPLCHKELELLGDFWYCRCGYLWYQPEVKDDNEKSSD